MRSAVFVSDRSFPRSPRARVGVRGKELFANPYRLLPPDACAGHLAFPSVCRPRCSPFLHSARHTAALPAAVPHEAAAAVSLAAGWLLAVRCPPPGLPLRQEALP